jgi:hypothetical protein
MARGQFCQYSDNASGWTTRKSGLYSPQEQRRLCHHVKAGTGAKPASYSMDAPLLGVNQSERESDRLSSPSAEVTTV